MIPKTMKAAVVEKYSAPLSIGKVPVPRPGPGDVLLELVARGVRHTDVHAAKADWPIKLSSLFSRT